MLSRAIYDIDPRISGLSRLWAASGVKRGDLLLLHSRCARTLRRLFPNDHRLGIEIILDSFLDAVGPTGTLLVPLFNYDFTVGVAFDLRSTPSQMGALTEAVCARPNAVRTGHPIYSFAALGARSDLFENLVNYSGFGPDSPFAILKENNGRIAVLDLPDQTSMTYYHFIEESVGVDYRYHKQFTGDYIDGSGARSRRTFCLYVRELEWGVLTSVSGMEKLLWDENLYQGQKPGIGCGLRTIDAKSMFHRTAEIIEGGQARTHLFEIDPIISLRKTS